MQTYLHIACNIGRPRPTERHVITFINFGETVSIDSHIGSIYIYYFT